MRQKYHMSGFTLSLAALLAAVVILNVYLWPVSDADKEPVASVDKNVSSSAEDDPGLAFPVAIPQADQQSDLQTQLELIESQLALTQSQIDGLSAEIEQARLRANPDAERLKQQALADLKAEFDDMKVNNAMFRDMLDSIGSNNDIMLQRNRMRYSQILEQLGYEGPALERLLGRIEDFERTSYEISNQRLRGELSATEHERIRSGMPNFSEFLAEQLPSNEASDFEQALADARRQDRLSQNEIQIRATTRSLSEPATELFSNAYTAMQEVQITSLRGLDQETRLRLQLENLDAIRDKMAEQVSAQDLIQIETFLERQRVSIERRILPNR